MTKTLQALRKFALSYPAAQEGVACEGTSLEKRTVKAGNKAFLFLGVADVMLKLGESLAEAMRLASKEPSRYKVGANGWATVTIADDESAPLELLKKWIDESYRMLVPKKLVAMLPDRGRLTGESKASSKKGAKKKATSRQSRIVDPASAQSTRNDEG